MLQSTIEIGRISIFRCGFHKFTKFTKTKRKNNLKNKKHPYLVEASVYLHRNLFCTNTIDFNTQHTQKKATFNILDANSNVSCLKMPIVRMVIKNLKWQPGPSGRHYCRV